MSKVNHDKYDVVILGAGMGGLVCGCYLAKAGMKVLIVEKNTRPGGYCMSFSVNGFYFDACVHSLGSLRKGGLLSNILQRLNLQKKISIKLYNPSDTVIIDDYKISFWNELDKTIKEFSHNFPKERKNIKEFFYFLNSDQKDHAALRKLTFQDILDRYFRDRKLKAILSVSVLGNAGLPSSRIAAFTAMTFYKEFMLDGGYYPIGGVQKLPDILAERFKELGGTLILSDMVEKVHVPKGIVHGITTKKNGFVPCKYVVSNIDAKQLFLDLIDRKEINPVMVKRINQLIPSHSMFILFLGVNKKISTVKSLQNIWSLGSYNLDKAYDKAMDQGIDCFSWFFVRVLADGKSILAMTNASYKTARYWQENKIRLREIFIKKVVKIIPEIKNTIIFKSAATPHTLYGWTRNFRGASYGWAETPSQFALPGLSQTTFIRNLYQTGHWASIVQGVPGVMYLGKNTAGIIIRKEKKHGA